MFYWTFSMINYIHNKVHPEYGSFGESLDLFFVEKTNQYISNINRNDSTS